MKVKEHFDYMMTASNIALDCYNLTDQQIIQDALIRERLEIYYQKLIEIAQDCNLDFYDYFSMIASNPEVLF